MNRFRTLYFVVSFIVLPNLIVADNAKFPDFTQLVKEVAPAVVNVSASRAKKRDSRKSLLDELFRRRNPTEDEEEQQYTPQQMSEGSGFIISADGYVLTNRHVVLQADEIIVRMNNGREYKAELIGEDNGTDVALLKIDGESLPVLKTGHSEKLDVGEWVLGFGAPFGFDQTVTAGIVSAKKRTLGREQYVPYIQTDVAINPGNSGGPLVSLEGKVVGINSQILSRSGGYIGLSFAIPIELALHVAEQFKLYGKIHRGYLGVQYQDVTYELAQAFDMDKVEGALLTKVTEGSVAEKAGLLNGDIILRLDGKPIERAGELPFIVGLIKPGRTVNVDIVRNSKKMKLDLTVGERPDDEVAMTTTDSESEAGSLGLIVEDIEDSEGIIVTKITDGPAARAGIRRGDMILSVANKKIKSVEHFSALITSLPSGIGIPVLIFRAPGIQRFLTLRIPE